jgi:ligand-binding sensor domain-containing protein/putative methionine-R-sulfoxide reductase with GAF domain
MRVNRQEMIATYRTCFGCYSIIKIMQQAIGFYWPAWLTALLLVLGVSDQSLAQPNRLRFEHLTLAQGFSHSLVTCALQDREGFMWFGTRYGLNKYDGYTFTVFRFDPNNPANSLQHNYIKSIYEDKIGRLWVITQGGGLHQVDKRTGQITSYACPPLRDNPANVLHSFYEDRAGYFWLGAASGLLRFDPRTHQFAAFPQEQPIHVVGQDAAGQLWAHSRTSLYRLNGTTGQLTPVPLTLVTPDPDPPLIQAVHLDSAGVIWLGTFGYGLYRFDSRAYPEQVTVYNPGQQINAKINTKGIYQDRQGYLWLATTKGLQRLDPRNGQVITYQSDPNQVGSLSSNDVLCVYQDQLGTLWVGTNNGVSKADAYPKPFRVYQIRASESVRLAENKIRSVLQDRAGAIWLGVTRMGLYVQPPGKRAIEQVALQRTYPSRLTREEVGCIYEDRAGRLWIGGQEGLYLLDRASGQFTRYPARIPVLAIDEDAAGNLWIGGRFDLSNRGGIASFDPVRRQYRYYYATKDGWGLNTRVITDLLVSRSGDVWVSTFGGGINRLNPKTGRFTYIRPGNPFPAGRLNDINIRTIFEDQRGIMWVGTSQGGLNRLDPKTGLCTYFTTREGLASNQVLSIKDDAQGNLWIGTNQGLSWFNPQTKTFRNFDTSDGLPDNEFMENSVYRRNDQLFFGTANGYISFRPDSINGNTSVPRVYITDLKVQEKSRGVPPGRIKLPYNQNFLAFDFVALNYDSPEKNQYAYQLVSLDKNWVQSGTRRYASYPGLPPGNYTFRVKAANNDGVWNQKGATLQIEIAPPYWQTWWFYGGVALALAALAGLYLQQREKRIKAREAQKTEIEKLKTLRYQHQLEVEKVNNFFAASMAELKNADDILWDVARNCIAQLSFENCVIYLLDTSRRVLVQKAAWGPESTNQTEIDNPLEIALGQGIIGTVAATGKAVMIADTFVDSKYSGEGTYQQSVLSVPMIDNGRVIGVIDSEHSQKDFYTEQHLQMLTSIAAHCTDRMNKVTAEQEVRKKEIELITLNRDLALSRLRTLRTQMNPHFIFNSLNSIQYYIALSDKQAAMSYLSKFARLVRQILENSVHGQAKLSDELELLENYVALEQLRLENTFDFVIQVDEELLTDNLEIPSMLIQPYVENAILHGLKHLTDRRGQLRLAIRRTDDNLICVIEDNGIGRGQAGQIKSAHKSAATELSQRRLQELSGYGLDPEPHVTIVDVYDRDQAPAGTRVELVLPVFDDLRVTADREQPAFF